MGTDQRQHLCGRHLWEGKIAESVHDLVTGLPGLDETSGPFQTKDLLDALPLLAKPVIEIRITGDLAMLSALMTFLPRLGLSPAPPIRGTIAQTGRQYPPGGWVDRPW